MKFQIFQFLPRYFSEATIVFISILLSFYFEDLRITKEKSSYKNELVVDMQKIIDLELNQLNNIRILQNRCLVAGEELLSDLLSQNQSLTDREIAERLLLLMQRGTVSFFSQNGIYEELKSTGSTELIKSKNFRYALSETYNNLPSAINEYDINLNSRNYETTYGIGEDGTPITNVLTVHSQEEGSPLLCPKMDDGGLGKFN